MSLQTTVRQSIADICSQHQFQNVFSPLTDLPATCTKAELICHILNTELGGYGVQSYVSPDKTSIFINDQGMSKVVDFFKGTGYHPVLRPDHAMRVKKVLEVANNNKVDLLWAQTGLKRKYYYFKQYGFNGVNLYNVLNLNTLNTAAAATSPVGVAPLSMAGIVAISWTGSLFLSTVENYIPNTERWIPVKVVVSGAKFGLSLPIRCVEWTSNRILGFVEHAAVGHPLPTNVTEVYKLNIGPKLKDLSQVTKPGLRWLIKNLERLNN